MMFDKSETAKSEYRGIESTEFWAKFIGEIMAARDSAMRSLASAKLENVAALQGRVWALDRVLALPKKIVEGPTEDESAPEA